MTSDSHIDVDNDELKQKHTGLPEKPIIDPNNPE